MTDVNKMIKPLSGCARDVLYQLVMNGPTWDGNITSKAGRGDLFDLGLAERVNGWTFITRAGAETAEAAGMFTERERRDRKRRPFMHWWRPGLAKVGERVIVVFKGSPNLVEHKEIGIKNADGTWRNNYGHAFTGEPDAWRPIPEYESQDGSDPDNVVDGKDSA